LFPEIFTKSTVIQFDQRLGSSDGGAILLKAADRRYRWIEGLAGCLRDERQAGKADPSVRELLAQRVFSIACGYPDANDSARLAADPMHKMLLDRDPVAGRDLASQPTLSRFENSIRPRELYRLGEALAASVIERHAERLRGRARLVTIDLDPTDDPTHGAQQLSFFNGHYDSWCYLPMMGFVSFHDEAGQYLCAAVLRPGNVTAAVGAVGILRRLTQLIRYFFPGVQLRVRLDGGFAHPELPAFLDAEPNLEYVVAMAKNAVLKRRAKPAMRPARKLSRRISQTEHVYGQACYAAQTWPRERRRIIKTEVVRAERKKPKDNPRFVITNRKQSPQFLYEKVYCQRGEIENRIKELHDLQIDRTSGGDFWANQFRVLLTAAAYVLMQELRPRATGTPLRTRSSLDAPRTIAATGCPGAGFGAPRGRASTRVVPVSTCLPASGTGARRLAGIVLPRSTQNINFKVLRTAVRESTVPEKLAAAQFRHTSDPHSPPHWTLHAAISTIAAISSLRSPPRQPSCIKQVSSHVVAGEQRIRVVLSGPPTTFDDLPGSGKVQVLEAKVIGLQKEADLALLKVQASNLPTLRFRLERDPQAGELVFAIGSPEGLQNSLTMGVISSPGGNPIPITQWCICKLTRPLTPATVEGRWWTLPAPWSGSTPSS
jgi:hypothetical protein